MEKEKSPKVAKKYRCEKCDYECCKMSDYDKHFTTRKHIGKEMEKSGNKKLARAYLCVNCNKSYKTASGLWKHTKICNIESDIFIPNNVVDESSTEIKVLTNLVLEMVKSNNELQKQNTELQQKVLEVCKNNNTNMSINCNNSNSNNKTFNLQFFLNEQCKDAMNISDFANSFDLQLSDLESVGELGYIEGITKIIVDKLNTMDIYKRPMHCSDAKREILYIKDEDKWAKEPRNNPRLRHAIKTISFKSMKLTNLWSDAYPESKNGDSRLNDKYMKLIKESTGGNGELVDSENKIIRRIAKEVIIEKS